MDLPSLGVEVKDYQVATSQCHSTDTLLEGKDSSSILVTHWTLEDSHHCYSICGELRYLKRHKETREL